MSELEIIEQAQKLIQPINLNLPDWAYYPTIDGQEQEGYYCKDCIDAVVEATKQNYIRRRKEITDKYILIKKNGITNGLREKFGKEFFNRRIKENIFWELKEFELLKPVNQIEFDYEDCDPDFSGSLKEPRNCDNCGEYFDVWFSPDSYYAELMLEDFKESGLDDELLKWKLDKSFDRFYDCDEDVQEILLGIAKVIIERIK